MRTKSKYRNATRNRKTRKTRKSLRKIKGGLISAIRVMTQPRTAKNNEQSDINDVLKKTELRDQYTQTLQKELPNYTTNGKFDENLLKNKNYNLWLIYRAIVFQGKP